MDCEREGRGRAAARPLPSWRVVARERVVTEGYGGVKAPRPTDGWKVCGKWCRGRRPRRPAEGSRPLPTMQTSNRRRRRVAGRACPAPTGWWMVGGCWPGGTGGIYAAPCGQAYCTIRISDKHHSISKGVLPAPLSFFVVSCYNILCIVMYKIYRERYLFITYAAFEKL